MVILTAEKQNLHSERYCYDLKKYKPQTEKNIFKAYVSLRAVSKTWGRNS